MAEHIQIGDVAPRIQYMGNGTQTQFTYPFPIFAAADMEVYLDESKQTSGFTVNGANQSAGGDVAFDAAPGSGVVVTLRRRLAIQRTSDFQESGEFRSKVINDELDYLTAGLQQVSDDGGRALRLSATDPTAALTLPAKMARANMFLAFDSDGDAIASDASGPPGPVGPAGNMDGANNLSELTDPATARSNLGLGAAAVESVAAGGLAGLLRADGSAASLTDLPEPPAAMPAGAVIDFAGTSEPEGWLFAFGQAVSRTAYAALFAAIGTTFGAGDGSTTFNLPDARGRVIAGKDDMGGTSANRLTNQSGGLNGDALGAAGGAETHTLTVAEMPAHAHGGGAAGQYDATGFGGGSGIAGPSATSSAGGGGSHNNVQPTIILNKIIKA